MENPLNQSSLAFALLGTLHLFSIVCGVGCVLLMSVRLMGVGLTRTAPSTLWGETLWWAIGGLMFAIFSGFLLFMIAPGEYLENPVFRWKLEILTAAVIFYFTIVRWAALRDRQMAVVGILSALLFAAVPLCGIYLGYE